AAIDFDDVHILGIELGSDIGGDVGIGYGDAVNKPGELMAAADVKLIVNEIRAGSVRGNEIQAVGAGGAGSFRDGLPRDRDGIGRRRRVDGLSRFADFDAFRNAGDVEREMPERRGVYRHAEVGEIFAKSVAGDPDGVVTCRYSVHLKFATVVGDGLAFPVRL